MVEMRRESTRIDRAGTKRVCVAIPTYRRKRLLSALLEGLREIGVPTDCEVSVVVFDNDIDRSAETTVVSARFPFPFSLEYVHVPEPGLATVRNRALDVAISSSFEFLAMIDDDECPQRQWLEELLRVQSTSDADAVIGAVPQELPKGTPRWIRRGRFFDLPVYDDGAVLKYGYSGNCLLKTSTLVACDIRFDEALNFAGGEDMLFFRQLYLQRAKIVYAARAVAVEEVHQDRLNLSYILRMQFRRGNTLAICDRRLQKGPVVTWLRAGKSVIRLGIGLCLALPLTALRGKAGAVAAFGYVMQALGAFAGLLGHIYLGYRRKTVRDCRIGGTSLGNEGDV
jgi:succinoglycan biosynthesis protein ExoM